MFVAPVTEPVGATGDKSIYTNTSKLFIFSYTNGKGVCIVRCFAIATLLIVIGIVTKEVWVPPGEWV